MAAMYFDHMASFLVSSYNLLKSILRKFMLRELNDKEKQRIRHMKRNLITNYRTKNEAHGFKRRKVNHESDH